MSIQDDVASLDTMRDMDEEDRPTGLEEEGTYHILVSEVFEVRGRDVDDAYQRFLNDEASFLDDDSITVRKVDD